MLWPVQSAMMNSGTSATTSGQSPQISKIAGTLRVVSKQLFTLIQAVDLHALVLIGIVTMRVLDTIVLSFCGVVKSGSSFTIRLAQLHHLALGILS